MPSIAPTLTFSGSGGFSFFGAFDGTGVVDAINAAIFAEAPISVADWADYFRKMEYATASRHGIEVLPEGGSTDIAGRFVAAEPASRKYLFSSTMLGATPEWVDGVGLITPSMPNLEILTNASFYRINTGDARCKVTSDPTFASSAVSFSLTGEVDVFLTPCYHFWYAQAGDLSGVSFNYYNLLNGICRPYDREEYYENAPLEAIYSQPVLCNTAMSAGLTAGQRQTVGEDFEGWQKGVDNAKYRYTITDKSGNVTSQTMESPASFPITTSSGNTDLACNNTVPYDGLLLAVLRRGNNNYYVWGVNNESVPFFGFGQPFSFQYVQA